MRLNLILILSFFFIYKFQITNKSTTEQKNTRVPLTTPERRRGHRLSQAHVRLERLTPGKLERVGHRTRNARVAEFKEQNIMTRNRQSLDKLKTTTQRVEHLKKIAPATSKRISSDNALAKSPSTPTSRRSSASTPNTIIVQSPKATTSSRFKATELNNGTKPNSLKRTRTNAKQQTKDLNQSPVVQRNSRRSSTSKQHNNSNIPIIASPSLTPLAKRRSVPGQMSPIAINLRNQSKSSQLTQDTRKSNDAKTSATNKVGTRQTISKIPTRSASLSRLGTASNTQQSQSEQSNRSLQSTKSMLPLRRGTLRKKTTND